MSLSCSYFSSGPVGAMHESAKLQAAHLWGEVRVGVVGRAGLCSIRLGAGQGCAACLAALQALSLHPQQIFEGHFLRFLASAADGVLTRDSCLPRFPEEDPPGEVSPSLNSLGCT